MISMFPKTLFVHIPKCGGQSIETAFLQDLHLCFARHKKLLLCLPRPETPERWPGPPRLAHLRARDYVGLDYVSKEFYSMMFSFAVVRDPFQRIYSHWKYEFQGELDFEGFVHGIPALCEQRHWFFLSQWEYVSDEHDSLRGC